MQSFSSTSTWTLEKTDMIYPLVRFVMHPDDEISEPSPAQLLFDVTDKLLSSKCVGVMADGASAQTLSMLSEIWHDGRLLRHGNGCSFVCIEPCFETPKPALKNAYLSNMASFHFALFSNTTPEETMFNRMLNTHTDAPLRIDIPESADEMTIVVHTNQLKENDFLNRLSEAVSASGRNLQYSA